MTQLRTDYDGTDLALVRDAMAAHALKLDLAKANDAWKFLCATTFGVIEQDIEAIETELAALAGAAHIHAGAANVETRWPADWRLLLGDPRTPRYAVVYTPLGTPNILSSIPGHPTQDVMARAGALATYLLQTFLLMTVTSPGSTAERLFAEIMLNDYFALWEVLFDSGVTNTYGTPDDCVLDHWRSPPDPMGGAACLAQLKSQRHPDFELWRDKVRNKFSAHVDPDAPIWDGDLARWPMTREQLAAEAQRVVDAVDQCARMDMRTGLLFMPPQPIKGAVGLSRQEGLSWQDG